MKVILSVSLLFMLCLPYALCDKWQPVRDVLNAAIANRTMPGCVALIADASGVLLQEAFGNLAYKGDKPPYSNFTNPATNLQTLYDMASLTKVTTCTTAMMQLYQKGLVHLDDYVSDERYLGSDYANNGKDRITLTNLLVHNSGLPADPYPGFADAKFPCPENSKEYPAQVFTCQQLFYKSIVNQPLRTPIGQTMVYSDLSMMTLMYVVGIVARDNGLIKASDCNQDCLKGVDVNSRLAGQCFYEAYIRKYVLEPLGMKFSGFLPSADKWGNTAPTVNDKNYRHRQLQGHVHDPNTYAMGGISGHAGFFSNVLDVQKLMEKLRSAGPTDSYINRATVDLFTKVHNRTLSTRALGWDTNDYYSPNEGSNICGTLSTNTYMHTGYTGTTICADPKRGLYSILLANAVYPNDGPHAATTKMRKDFNTAVASVYDSL